MSQSNSSADFLENDDKYKFVDDLSILEIINLVSIGIASYNFRHHVASDIGVDMKYVTSENLQSQLHLDKISAWTDDMKMKLNEGKCKVMVFNETINYQFVTRLYVNNLLLDNVQQTTLLGVVITSDLKWHENTKLLVKRAYRRTIILVKLYEFNVPQSDLINIYILFIRSVLEQSCVVWNSAITKEEVTDLERVQKTCLRMILKQRYTSYEEALKIVNLETLSDRREKLCLQFAEKCLMSEKTKGMFPLHQSSHDMAKNIRHHEKYHVQHANTDRLKKSAIPYMQRLLNRQCK